MAPSAQVIPITSRKVTCEECALVGQCLARDVDHPEADGRYDIQVTPRILRSGDHLFRTGDRFSAVYLVRSGAIKSSMISVNGEEQVIGFHLPGDLIGLDAIDSARHVCEAEALDTSSVCVLPFDKLSRLCARSSTVNRRLLKGMSRKMLNDEAMLLMLGQKSADQRLAAFLLGVADKRRQQGYSSLEIDLPMSRADIGSYLALAVETVSRMLTRLQQAKVLAVQRNRIRILDMQALMAIADEEGVQSHSVVGLQLK